MPTRLDALLRFLEEDPDDPFTRYAIALEYASRDDLPSAIAALEETLVRNPDYVPAHQQLGQLYDRAGDTARAVAAYRRGIDIARAHGDTHAAQEMALELDQLEDL